MSVNQPETAPASGDSMGTRLKRAAQSAAKNAGRAAQLTGKQIQRTTLAKVTLPAAYKGLGKHAYKSKAFAGEFPEIYQEFSRLTSEMAAIKTGADARLAAEGMTAKAKAAALSTKDMAQTKTFEMKVSQAFGKFGKAVYEKHGDKSGPPEIVNPIVEILAQNAVLEAEILAMGTDLKNAAQSAASQTRQMAQSAATHTMQISQSAATHAKRAAQLAGKQIGRARLSGVVILAVSIVLIGLIGFAAFQYTFTDEVLTNPIALIRHPYNEISVDGVKLGDNISKVPKNHLLAPNHANDGVLITHDAMYFASSDGRIESIGVYGDCVRNLSLQSVEDCKNIESVFGRADFVIDGNTPQSISRGLEGPIYFYYARHLEVAWNPDLRGFTVTILSSLK